MAKNRRLFTSIGLGILIILTVFALNQPALAPKKGNVQKVSFGNEIFHLERATTSAEREKGLGGRSELADNEGMLFTFDSPDTYCFWMKDTLLPLDIIWLDKNYHVIHRAMDVQPDTYPTSFCPPRAAQYVVELKAGTATRINLQQDDVMSLL